MHTTAQSLRGLLQVYRRSNRRSTAQLNTAEHAWAKLNPEDASFADLDQEEVETATDDE